jgi:hypothetical protein
VLHVPRVGLLKCLQVLHLLIVIGGNQQVDEVVLERISHFNVV